MNHPRVARSARLVAAAFVTAAMFCASAAHARLVLESRFVSRSGGEDVQVGDVMSFDVFAVVTGRNADLTDEALQSIHGRFLSKDVDGGFLRGNIDAAPIAPYTAAASFGGAAQDLDGDGDLDRGATDPSNATGWFVARASPGSFSYTSGEPQEIKFATLTFTVTDVLGAPEDPGDTLIQFEQRPWYTAGLWFVDGELRDWTLEPGITEKAPVTLADGPIADPDGFFFPPTSLEAVVTIPEPATAGLLLISGATLLRRRTRHRRAGAV